MRVWLLVVVLAGCSSERAQTVTLNTPSATESAATPVAPPSVARSAPHRNACVMLYECGCNAGCTAVDQPVEKLKAGMRVGVVSGPLKGTSIFVAQSRTDDGQSVFTVQRADPASPIQVCLARSPLVGYLCAVKDSGAARACDTCE